MSDFPPEIQQLAADLAQYGNQEVTVVAYLKARPGREGQTHELLLSLVAPTLEEDGCIDYILHRSNDDPGVFLYYENWRSKEDLDEHLAMPHLTALFEKKEDLLAEPIDVKLLTRTSHRTA